MNNNISTLITNISLPYYKLNGLKEDKLVYFTYGNNINEYSNSHFIICGNKKDVCINDTIIYNFLKGKEYTIYFNKIKNLNEKTNFNHYSFFPILENTIQRISKEGHLLILLKYSL